MVLLHIWLVYGPPVHSVVDSISMYCIHNSFYEENCTCVYYAYNKGGPFAPGMNYHVRPPSFLSTDIQEQLLTFIHGMLSNDSYIPPFPTSTPPTHQSSLNT